MSTPAERLELSREKAQKEVEEMMEVVGVNKAWYYDLEGDEDELSSTLSIRQVCDLSRALSIDPVWLLTGEALKDLAPISPADLVKHVRDYLTQSNLTLSQFEDLVGYRISHASRTRRRLRKWIKNGMSSA